MTLELRIDGNLIDNRVRMNGRGPDGIVGFPGVAWYCEPATSGVLIDDPLGELDIKGWHTFTADETDCAKPRIFAGWITGRRIHRGQEKRGAGAVWDCDIIDINEAFHFEVFRSSAASIVPAQTDVARVQHAITSHAMAGTPVFDNGRLSTDNPLNLSAANFVTQYPVDMINNAAGQCLKNAFVYWDDDAAPGEGLSIHYDAIGVGPAAGFAVSNVIADVDNETVFYPTIDAVEERDPSDEYTGVLLLTSAGNFYDRNDALIDALNPSEFSVEFKRDVVERSDRIGRSSTASSYLQKLLIRHGQETETLKFSVKVPASKVNLAKAGDVITVRFSHLPDFRTDTEVFIIRRNVVPYSGRRDMYLLNLECTNNASGAGTGGGDPGDLPSTGCLPVLRQTGDVVDTSSNIFGAGLAYDTGPPAEGSLQVCWIIQRDHTDLAPTGWTAAGAWQDDAATGGGHKQMEARFFYRFTVAGDPQTVAFDNPAGSETCYVQISEWTGVDTFVGLDTLLDDSDQGTDPQFFGSNLISLPANVTKLAIYGMFPSLNTNDAWHPSATDNATELGGSGVGGISAGGAAAKSWLGYKAAYPTPTVGSTSFAIQSSPASGNSRGSANMVILFTGECDQVSTPGQPVEQEIPTPAPDGTQTTFFTAGPYVAGTLRVFVDDTNQTAAVTAESPDLGQFTLAFAPTSTEVIKVNYTALT